MIGDRSLPPTPTGSRDCPDAPSKSGRGWWSSTVAGLGTATGLLPHLLHHVSLLAGSALIAGVGGTVAFGALGLLAMVPLLLRLRRRFGSWWPPAIAVAGFMVMFAVSTFVLGPALRGAVTGTPDDGPVTPSPTAGPHQQHHGP